VLVFTKKIGTGVVATALKKGIAKETDIEASVQSMLTLNKAACEAMLQFDVHGCTDVSGFGLLGHARELASGSRVTVEIEQAAVQFLPGAVDYAGMGAIPGGLKNNREFVMPFIQSTTGVSDLLFDPQTSGGLLISLSEADAAGLMLTYPAAYRIGRVIHPTGKAIHIV
jgi:selenide,water dikinase